MNMPFTYDPLFEILDECDMTLDDLYRNKIVSDKTVQMIGDGQQITLSSVAKICRYLGCEFNDVISLNCDYDPNMKMDDGTQNYKEWTPEETMQLIDEYINGFPINTIAKNMGRTSGAISSRISKLIFSGKVERRQNKK